MTFGFLHEDDFAPGSLPRLPQRGIKSKDLGNKESRGEREKDGSSCKMTEVNLPSGRPSLDQNGFRLDGHSRSNTAESIVSVPERDRISRPGHQRLVFADPVALRYLEEDPSTTVLERRRRLEGYEIYLVEQWACSRSHPTFIITTYTGDMSQSIMVGVLSVPNDENAWSSRLKVYFQAIQQFHARKKETPLGTLMVTNLSGFPSALSVIAVPDGDIRQHRQDFLVNEDLKRMGCSGRAGLQLQRPASSTQAKYYHVYHTSDKVSLYTSVIELVKLCQLALVIFDKLKSAYADGLLCDVTERALTDWWSDIGTDIYNLEPNDGILGPSTVSAVLGLLMGSHNRLKAAGAPVTKDPFDVGGTKRAIEYFQKAQKLPRTRRLDRQTIDKLQRSTAKAASGEGWTVPRAVKSTVAELSGKGGEMVMGMVGARDKVGISEIETLDIERLAQLATGSRARWIWQGKPMKQGSMDLNMPTEQKDMVFAKDNDGGYLWTSKRRDTVMELNRTKTSGSEAADESMVPPDQKSGLDRLKDRVNIGGQRPHHHHHLHHRHHQNSRDLTQNDARNDFQDEYPDPAARPLERQGTDASVQEGADYTASDLYVENKQSKHSLAKKSSFDISSPDIVVSNADEGKPGTSLREEPASYMDTVQQETSPIMEQTAFAELLPVFDTQEPRSIYLWRSHSARGPPELRTDDGEMIHLPRQLSFSFIEDTIMGSNGLGEAHRTKLSEFPTDPVSQTRGHDILAKESYRLSKKILSLEKNTLPLTISSVELVDDLEELGQRQHQDLNSIYHERLEDFLTLQSHSTDIVKEERMRLEEAVRRVDVLGAKLDYELNALESRIEEVEDGVTDFEKNIVELEGRIDDLVNGGPTSRSWVSWFAWPGNK